MGEAVIGMITMAWAGLLVVTRLVCNKYTIKS